VTTSSLPRLHGLDAARGLAVLGMFAAHVGNTAASFDWASPASWPAVTDGRASILFAFCAGISLVLMTVRRPGTDPATDRRRIVCRAIAVFIVGTVLQVFPSGPLIILPTYAALFVAAIPFLRLRLRWAVVAAVASLVAGPVVALVMSPVVERGGGGFAEDLVHGYPAVSWFGVVLAGVVLARVGLERSQHLMRALAAGIALSALGYGGGALLATALGVDGPSPLRGVVTAPDGGAPGAAAPLPWANLVSTVPHAGSTFELVGATGIAMAVVAVLCLVGARCPAVLWPLSVVGSMALTLYAGHVVAMSIWAASGSPGVAGPLGGWVPYIVLALAAVAAGALRARSGRQGPLEWVVRWASRLLDDRSPERAVSARCPEVRRGSGCPPR
jgi:uncharacterized membrane protein YeiB